MIALFLLPLGNHALFYSDSRFRHNYGLCHVCAGNRSRRRRCRSGCCRWRCLCRRRRSGRRRSILQTFDTVARLADGAYRNKHRYLVSILVEDFQKLALRRRLALKGGLVCLVGKEHVSDVDMIALFLLPLRNHALLHGDSCLRHNHSLRHVGPRRSRSRRSGRCRRRCLCRRCRSRLRASSSQGRYILSRLTDCAYIRQHRNLVSILIKNFQQLSLCCGFALKRRLVRLISEKNVAHIHMVALLFQPLGNHALFHGDSRFRHHYAYCHFSYLHLPGFIYAYFLLLTLLQNLCARFLRPQNQFLRKFSVADDVIHILHIPKGIRKNFATFGAVHQDHLAPRLLQHQTLD